MRYLMTHCSIELDVVFLDGSGSVRPEITELYNKYLRMMEGRNRAIAARNRGRAASSMSQSSSAEGSRVALRGGEELEREIPIKDIREWLRTSGGRALERWILDNDALEGLAALRRAYLKRIDEFPRPVPGSDRHIRLEAILQYLREGDILYKLFDRFESFLNDTVNRAILTEMRLVNYGHINILMGNIAEVLSIPRQIETVSLLARRLNEPLTLFTGVRVRIGTSGGAMLYSDNVIGRIVDGNLWIYHVFEVKSGFNGGVEAAKQVVRWDRSLSGPVQLIIPRTAHTVTVGPSDETVGLLRVSAEAHMSFLDPNQLVRHGDELVFSNAPPLSGPHVFNLRNAQRDIVNVLGQDMKTSLELGGESTVGLQQQLTHLAPEINNFTISGVNRDDVTYLAYANLESIAEGLVQLQRTPIPF